MKKIMKPMNNSTFAKLQLEGHKRNLQIICVVEHRAYSTDHLTDLNVDFLVQKGICKGEDRQYSFQVTGFTLCNNTLIVIFPKGYQIPDTFNEILDHIRVLSGAIFRYREEGQLLPEENELLAGGVNGGAFGIAAALWIMRDFMTYGLIRKDLKIKRIGHGAVIDWARTVKYLEPYMVSGRPIYLDFVVRDTNRDQSNKLFLLHRYAVNESLRMYGWILGKETDLEKEYIPSPFESTETRIILQQELTATNVDREIKLIKALQHFLVGASEEKKDERFDTFATPYFHHVWEKMCGALFENEYQKLRHLVPNPVWFWNNRQKATVQIPDILFRHHGMLYILDAKYYDTTRNLPGWHDLVKQYFYAYSLKDIEKKYMNVMVFPTSSETINGIKHSGYSIISEREDLGRVEAVSLNTYYAMKCYGTYSSPSLRDTLSNLVGP